jgi:predicted nucleic acid-binding protein
MIDTNVFDRLVDDAAALEAVAQAVRDRRLALFTTPVQEAQVAAVPDPVRRKRLQRVPREVVPPAPAVGAEFAAVQAGRTKHTADAVIAETARTRCDVLVTEDARLAERAGDRGLGVWGVIRLVEWARAPAGAD